ncbi:MAG: GH32 C-terminal domain-containing protein, partial [Tumebacillaceae bacterium]
RTFTNDASPETVLWLDHGRDNYAGVTWSDLERADGSKLFIGWMSNWKYANVTPTVEWRSAMTLPRDLSLKTGPSGVRLVQTPVAEVRQLRKQSQSWADVTVQPGENILAEAHGDLYEIECEIEMGDAAEVGFKLRKSEREETVVGYQAAENLLFLDRIHSGESSFHELFACQHGVQMEPTDGRIKLHMFVDQSSVEVFANNGEIAITDQIFPSPSSTGMELYVTGGSAKVITLHLHKLKSMWPVE